MEAYLDDEDTRTLWDDYLGKDNDLIKGMFGAAVPTTVGQYREIMQQLTSGTTETRNTLFVIAADALSRYGVEPQGLYTLANDQQLNEQLRTEKAKAIFNEQNKEPLKNMLNEIDQYLVANPMQASVDTNVRTKTLKTQTKYAERFVLQLTKNAITQYLAASDRASREASALRVDMNNDLLGEAATHVISQEPTLSAAMRQLQTGFRPDDISYRIMDRIKQLAIDNDVDIAFMSKGEIETAYGQGVRGLYDNRAGKIILRDDLDLNSLTHTLVHEGTHAYLNRSAFAYNNFVNARARGENVSPYDFGLTNADAEFFATAQELMESVRGSDVFGKPAYEGIATAVDANGNATPYGLSFDPTSQEAVVEFVAEMMGSPKFRQAVAEAHAKKNDTNLRTARSRIRDLLRRLAEFLGFTKRQDADVVGKFIEDGMTTLSSVPYQAEYGQPSFLKSAKSKSTRERVLRYVLDQEKGIQYYTFKYDTGIDGQPSVGEASAYRIIDDNGNLTNEWSLSYRNKDNEWVQEDGLTATQLGERAVQLGLKVISRSGGTRRNHHVNEQIERVWALHPALAKTVLKIRDWVRSFTNDETADDFTDKFIGWALKMEYYTQDRDVVLTWATRMAVAKYGKDAVSMDLQNEANIIRSRYNNFFAEHGVAGKATGLDKKVVIEDFIKKYGWTDDFAKDVVYASMARERARQFAENKGGINPYTGEHWRDTNVVSGFKFTDRSGNRVSDEDGSKFFAQLDVEQQRQVDEFTQMWIDQNNAVLDLEYESGVLSTEQYESMYNKFYAPLKNEWDKATAFYKMARGRVSEAKDPFTNWYAHAEMRVSYALRQREHQMLLAQAADFGLDNLFVVNQTQYVGRSDTIGKQWQAPNMSDGTSWSVYKDGIRHTLTIKDPVLQQAYKNMRTWESRGSFWTGLSYVTRAMSAVRTTFSPAFLPMAYGRDLVTALVNAQAAYRSMTGEQMVSNAEAMALAPKIVSRAVSSVAGILKGKWTGQRGWEYDVFKRYGGGVVMNARQDFEDHNKWLKDNVFKKGMTAKQLGAATAKKGVHKLSQISHSLEDSVRFGAFMEFVEMKARRKFNNEQELVQFLEANPTVRDIAINGSKNITGNFEIKGASTPLRAMYMFFNAGMVGARTFVHMFDPSHGSHGIKMASMIFGLSLAALAMMDGELGDDDDGKSKSLRVRATETGICFGMTGCVQMPHELHWVTAGAKAIYHSIKGDMSVADATSMVSKKLFQTFVPLSFGPDMTTGSDVAMGLIPTVLQLFAQNILNQDAFGNPIVSQYAYRSDGSRIMDAPDWMKTKMSDPEIFKSMALELNRIFGLDVSSSEITHGFQQVGGGIASALLKVMRGTAEQQPPSEIMSKVFLSGFIPTYDSGAIKRDLIERINKMKSDMSRGPNAQNMILSKDELQNNPDYVKLVQLENKLEKLERGITYNGRSYAEMTRQKIAGVQNDDIDAILEADNALDIMREQRNELYGDIWSELEDIFGE